MAENKDICEFGEERRDETGVPDSSTPSLPPWLENDVDSYNTGISSPFSNLSENIAAPDLEITSGRVDTADRLVTMIPQEFVYNFKNGLYISGRRNPERIPVGQNVLRLAPPESPSEYVSSGADRESVYSVFSKQDSLRYVCGKIYVSDVNSPVRSNFSLLNQNSIFRVQNVDGTNGPYISWLTGREFDSKIFIEQAPLPNISSTFTADFLLLQELKHLEIDTYISMGETEAAIRFATRRDEYSIRDAEDYLESIMPKVDVSFAGGELEIPAAFFKAERRHIQRTPGLYANIEAMGLSKPGLEVPVYQIENEGILQSGDNQYYQETSALRENKENVYVESLKRSLITADPDSNRPVDLLTPPAVDPSNDCVVVEKYSSSRLSMIRDINSVLETFTDNNSQDGTRERWIDTISPLHVKINFSTLNLDSEQSGQIANLNGLINQTRLESVFLALLDYCFSGPEAESYPIFDSVKAYSMEQDYFDSTANESDFYSTEIGAPAYSAKNDKVIFDYRPRVYKNFYKKLKDFFPTNAPLGKRIETIKKLFHKTEEYPLYHEWSDLLLQQDSDNNTRFTEDENKMSAAYITISQQVVSFVAALQDTFYNFFNRREEFSCPVNLNEIFNGYKVKHTTIAYRVEKVNVLNGKVIKEYYFFNGPQEEIEFYDAQVTPSDKYRYNIYAVNLVLDYKYSYTEKPQKGYEFIDNLTPGERTQSIRNRASSADSWTNSGTPRRQSLEETKGAPTVKTRVRIEPEINVVETPYFSQEVTMVDRPPLTPSVDLDKLGVDEQGRQEFRIRFSNSLGSEVQTPIAILEGDDEVIAKMQADQFLTRPAGTPDDALVYASDTPVEEYQALVLKEPPVLGVSEYDDFAEADVYKFSGRSPFFTFPAPVNEPRYMVFRSVDKNGISNPTKIFKFLLNSYGDGVYHEFDIYEPELETLRQPLELSCEKYVSLEPAMSQSSFNFGVDVDSSSDEMRDLLSSQPGDISIHDVSLGHVEDTSSIWDKKYKIRLKSTNTGRAVDINFKFLLERAVTERATTVQNRQRAAEGCQDPVTQKNQRILASVDKSTENIVSSGNSGQTGSDDPGTY